MNKKNNLAFFTLFIVGLFSLFTLNTLAQESHSDRIRRTKKANPENRVLQSYIDISSLPKDERKRFFGKLSLEEKANLFKLHLALQFIKRPNLTKEQKDLILEAISMITPDFYDKEKLEKSRQYGTLLEQKAKVLFSKQEILEIFADLGGGTNEINLLQKYLDISALSVHERMERRVSANDKSDLWRIHLAFHLAKLPGLNTQQMEIILEFITIATPEVYDIPRNSSEWIIKVNGPVQLLTSRAREVFSRNEIAKIFSNLGGKKPSSRDSITSKEIIDRDIHIEPEWMCDCAFESDTCEGFEFCHRTLCEVPPGGGECGVLGLFVCNGRCQ